MTDEYKEGELVVRMPLHLAKRFTAMINAVDYKFALQDADNQFKAILKYHDDVDSKALEAGIDKAREIIYECLEERKLELWSDE